MTSLVNTTDIDRSPCLDCPNHRANIDKRLCLGNCLRLRAYRDGQDYTKKEYYIVPEGKDLVEDITNDDSYDDIEPLDTESDVNEIEEEEIAEDDDAEDDLPVAPVTPEATWKKAMPKKQKPSVGHICVMDGCDHVAERRGCCIKCYCLWRKGSITHPTIGVFRKMTTPELQQARLEKLGICLIPGCKEIGSKRNLCFKHYRRYLTGKIDHPVLGPWPPPDKKKRTVEKPACTVYPTTVSIDLRRYPEIRGAVFREAIWLSLPVSHVAITLLSEALAARKERNENLKVKD